MRALILVLGCAVLVRAEPADSSARVGLALSGGGALGLAHVGVLKVLEREGIEVCGIAGCSMGSMVGGLYAAGYRAAEIESIAAHADWGTLFSSGVPFGARYLPERQQGQRYAVQLRHRGFLPSLPGGLVPLQNVEFLMMGLLAETEYNTFYDFDQLPIPYRAIAVDLRTGKLEVLRQGRVAQAIRASIAIPGVFAPEMLEGKELVDGGVQQYLPVEPLREFEPDLIVAVLTMRHGPETGISLIDVASRSMDVVGLKELEEQKKLAQVLIEPNVDPFMHSDFARAQGLIAAGEAAAEAALPEIRFRLAGRKAVQERNSVAVRPLAVVRSVRFEGARVTRESMLRPLMQTRPGRYLLFDRLRRDLVRLFHTGLFEDVNYRLEFGRGDSVDVTVELEERAYGFYSLGVRYDNYDNVCLGIEVGQGNLAGSGASVRGVIQLGDPNEYRLGLTGTRLFRLPFGYRVDGFWSSIDRSWYEAGDWRHDYSIGCRGGLAEAGYIVGRNAFFDVGLKAYQALYRLPAVSVFDTLPRQEWVVGPSFRFEYNSFDDLQVPSEGLSYRVGAFYSSPRLGAGPEFLKVDVGSQQALGMGPRLVLRPGWEFGLSWGRLAWAEYFRSGPLSLPGFAKEEFTSRNKLLGRLGLDFRLLNLFGQEAYPLYLQTFVALATFRDLDSLLQELELKEAFNWSVGAGVLTNTPIGPCRLAVGVADFGKPESDGGTRVNLFVAVGREFRYTH